MTASIGISLFPNDGEHAETLLKNADIALYHVKESGRNNYAFYSPAMNIRTLERMILENSLRQTLQRGELLLYHQPQVDIATRQIVCTEALVRWRHPELGLLNPMQFLTLAEETGFIVSMDEWVLRTACEQNKRLPLQSLKIDKSFVRDIASNPDDKAIITAIVAMAHSMKMNVAAEGVETEEQLAFLQSVGCDEMQGFLISEPLPIEEVKKVIALYR